MTIFANFAGTLSPLSFFLKAFHWICFVAMNSGETDAAISFSPVFGQIVASR
jgi:hypothetical protein